MPRVAAMRSSARVGHHRRHCEQLVERAAVDKTARVQALAIQQAARSSLLISSRGIFARFAREPQMFSDGNDRPPL